MNLKRAILICAASLFASSASSATVKSGSLKDGRVIITITGNIEPGDLEVFKAAVKSANDAGKLVGSIRLNSPGGNLAEGVRLAQAVKFAKMTANVGQDAVCASACFLIFAAGDAKYANYNARIGVHGASDKTGAEAGDATVSMARVAKDLGVPPAIIGRMVITPPDQMVWLSPSDLQTMGTTMVGKPAQVAPQAHDSIRPPMQLDSSASATAETKPESKDDGWKKLIYGAILISEKQNGGKALTSRACQPEFKTCFNAVSFVGKDGTETFVKVTKDMDDKVLRREFCTLNLSGDIRKCFDWDANASRRDMKDSKGNWYKVADE